MHLLPGNLIQVEGVGEGALTAFVWCQLDTSPVLLCWQGICLSPLLQTSAKGERGSWTASKAGVGEGRWDWARDFVARRVSAS